MALPAFVACGARDEAQRATGDESALDLETDDLAEGEWLARPDRGAWDPRLTLSGFTGQDGLTPTVFDFARDADGSLLVGGRFSWAGRKRVDPLVRFRRGRWQNAREDWNGKAPGGFSAVATDAKGRLALSTHLPQAPGLGSPFPTGAIWVDTGEGLRQIAGFRGNIRTLTWVGDRLWAAGYFQVDEPRITYLAVWDGTTWTDPPGGPASGPVYDLSENDGSVLVGGSFDTIGGIAAKRVAEWNGTEWKAYDMDLQPSVYTVAKGPDGELIAGGFLYREGEFTSGGIARWNGQQWDLLGGGVSKGRDMGVVSDAVFHRGKLHITGCFNQGVARWNGTQWESLEGSDDGPIGSVWFDPGKCGWEGYLALWDMPLQRLFSTGKELLVGGPFQGIGGVASVGIAAHDGKRWRARGGDGEQGLAGQAEKLAIGGPLRALHAMGNFTHVGDRALPEGWLSVLRRDGDRWTVLGAPRPKDVSCRSLAVDGAGNIFIGCTTRWMYPELPKPQVFRLARGEWVPLAEIGERGSLTDMAFDPEGRLWITGGWLSGEQTSSFVARAEGDAFATVERGFDGLVYRIDFAPPARGKPSEFVIGGTFTHIGSNEVRHIARWNGSAFVPLGAGLQSNVLALEYGAHAIYASTSRNGDAPYEILARWDGRTWVDIGTPERGLPAPRGEGTNRSVHQFLSLLEVGNHLVAAGGVWPETGGRNAFVFDGERFTSLGGGVNAISVTDVAHTRDGLWFGGTIAEVGTGEARQPSLGIAHWGRPRSSWALAE